VPLAGRPMVEWSIAAFRACEAVRSIVVACPPGAAGPIADELGGDGVTVVEGGATRSDSVSNALAAVEAELVAIHDAARPLVTPELIDGVVATLLADPEADAAIAAAAVTDTVKRVRGEHRHPSGTGVTFDTSGVHNVSLAVEETLDRQRLWAAQTPQVFRLEALCRALEAYPADAPSATDEAMLVEAAGGRVLIHPAPAENLKVTTPLDLKLAELLLAGR